MKKFTYILVVLFLFSLGMLASENSYAKGKSMHEEKECVDLLNSKRKHKGIHPLRWDASSRLQAAAEKRAKELEIKFSHTRPNGRDCNSVLKEYSIR